MTKHRRGSLTHARASAKAQLKRMPVGTRAVVGQWIDTGEYEAKVGGGMNWAHERFMPIEHVFKTARGTKTMKISRKNPRGDMWGNHIARSQRGYEARKREEALDSATRWVIKGLPKGGITPKPRARTAHAPTRTQAHAAAIAMLTAQRDRGAVLYFRENAPGTRYYVGNTDKPAARTAKKNPCRTATTRRLTKTSSATAVTRRMKAVAKNPQMSFDRKATGAEGIKRLQASKGPFHAHAKQGLIVSAATWKKMWTGIGGPPSMAARHILGWRRVTKAEARKLLGG